MKLFKSDCFLNEQFVFLVAIVIFILLDLIHGL
jgi:hypothetical protein